MKSLTNKDTMKTLTTHYIDGAFVESHGKEVMDVIKPTNGQVIARVTLGDEEDRVRRLSSHKVEAWASFPTLNKNAASNTDINAALETNRLRRDLYYRLNACAHGTETNTSQWRFGLAVGTAVIYLCYLCYQ
jgi:acyl-CoA reductase-like NAD-dependent aldehyde dehydrogenase